MHINSYEKADRCRYAACDAAHSYRIIVKRNNRASLAVFGRGAIGLAFI